MRGDAAMIPTILALLAMCGVGKGSVEHGVGVVPISPPVVASASSQFFERTFNRLVVQPIQDPLVPPVLHAAQPPIFIQPTAAVPAALPTNEPVQPNIAIAIATAQAAAPVATFFLPHYPFGVPPTGGFVPQSPPIVVADESTKEATTPTTTQVEVITTSKQEDENTTPMPLGSNSDNNFVQALPSNFNENENFQMYGPPQPQSPQQNWPHHQWNYSKKFNQQWPQQKRPQKLKTTVEIVPVPLAYIAPPPLPKFQTLRTVKHIHTFIPARAKIIIRPIHAEPSPLKYRSRYTPSKLIYSTPLTARSGSIGRPEARETEPTTFRPSMRPVTKPPRL